MTKEIGRYQPGNDPEITSPPEEIKPKRTVMLVSKEFADKALAKGLAGEPTEEELAERESLGGKVEIDSTPGRPERLIAVETSLVATLAHWGKYETQVNS